MHRGLRILFNLSTSLSLTNGTPMKLPIRQASSVIALAFMASRSWSAPADEQTKAMQQQTPTRQLTIQILDVGASSYNFLFMAVTDGPPDGIPGCVFPAPSHFTTLRTTFKDPQLTLYTLSVNNHLIPILGPFPAWKANGDEGFVVPADLYFMEKMPDCLTDSDVPSLGFSFHIVVWVKTKTGDIFEFQKLGPFESNGFDVSFYGFPSLDYCIEFRPTTGTYSFYAPLLKNPAQNSGYIVINKSRDYCARPIFKTIEDERAFDASPPTLNP